MEEYGVVHTQDEAMQARIVIPAGEQSHVLSRVNEVSLLHLND